jgi:hypothetical protein
MDWEKVCDANFFLYFISIKRVRNIFLTFFNKMLTEKTPKTPLFFSCEKCTFVCSKKSEWTRHSLTRKHQSLTDPLTSASPKTPQHMCCHCQKVYKSREGLWYHFKKCTQEPEPSESAILAETPQNEEVKTLTTMVMELMKSNAELQKQLIDCCKNGSNTIINNNSNNKTFNLQFFLNEQCKDAMNLSDFTNSFDLQLSDLETVGELGYVEGITKIMVDKLNAMDIYKRPIHCSDAKREIIYVKDENVWTKEKKDNPKLRQAIKNVSFRNMKLVYNWSNAYPESKDNQSKLNDKYMTLVIESTGGKGPILESENKIIRRIAKEIIIGKN